MPTYFSLPRFLREFDKLSPSQKIRYLKAVRALVEDLAGRDGFRPGLRIK